MDAPLVDDCFPCFDDPVDGNIAGNEEVLDSESTCTEDEPDTGVLKLHDLLATLRSNPLQLARFLQEEKVHISLWQLLMEINKAFLFAGLVILE